MRLRKLTRIALLVLGGLLAAAILLIALIPLWLPWAAPPISKKLGIAWARYDRLGYSRLALHEVSYASGSTVFHAREIALPTPLPWLLNQVRAPERNLVTITDWHLILGDTNEVSQQTSGQTNANPHEESSIPSIVGEAEGILAEIYRWAPRAEFLQGKLSIGDFTMSIPRALWKGGVLEAELATDAVPGQAHFSATLTGPPPWPVALTSERLDLDAHFQISRDATSVSLAGPIHWLTNSIDASVKFGPSDLLPQSAHIKCEHLIVPARLLDLPSYEDPVGSFALDWETGRFALTVQADAKPSSVETNLPPVHVDVRANGSTNSAVIDSAVVTTPWLNARLANPVTVGFTGPLLRQPGDLLVEADLSRQHLTDLTGLVKGYIHLLPTTSKWPEVHLQLSGSGIGNSLIATKTIDARGVVNWPSVYILEANVELDEGPTLTVSGDLNLAENTVAGGRVVVSGALPEKYVPRNWAIGKATAQVQLEGSLKSPAHQGWLLVERLEAPVLQPLAATVRWSGQALDSVTAEITASNEVSALVIHGTASSLLGNPEVLLDSLTLSSNETPCLKLLAPCRIKLNKNPDHPENVIAFEPISLSGESGSIKAHGRIAWPTRGEIEVLVDKLKSVGWTQLIRGSVGSWQVEHLGLRASWDRSPLELQLDVQASAELPKQVPASIDAQISGASSGLTVTNLVLNVRTSAVATASGFLPVTIEPASTNLLHLGTSKELNLQVASVDAPAIWDWLTTPTGLLVRNARLNARISGSLAQPKGDLSVHVGEIIPLRTNAPLPSLREFHLEANADTQMLRVSSLTLSIQGEPISASAELPLPSDLAAALKDPHLLKLDALSANLKVENVKLAPFASLYPNIMTPQGTLSANLAVKPGGHLEGELLLQHGRTRPFPTVGPLREIHAGIHITNEVLQVVDAGASIGGSFVTLNGNVSLADREWLRGELPQLVFTLYGTNVPLARSPESVIRSDLNLAIVRTNGAPPLVSGNAYLRNSFFLSDLSDLVPGRVTTPGRRPPYFSIDEPFLKDWRLAVDVQGDRFLKVRSSIFNGTVSASLKLQGTLENPTALGSVKIDEGLIRFPFASIPTTQGYVTLGSQNPFRPQLAITANSRNFGYDIKMEVSGPADTPVVQFSSTPPLSSEQIVLMITAGQMPQEQQVYSTQQRAQTLALFLGRDMLSKFGFGDDTEQRLTIVSGEEISVQGKPTYRVEYKLTPKWSLTGEYDQFNDFNAGLKWRVYSK